MLRFLLISMSSLPTHTKRLSVNIILIFPPAIIPSTTERIRISHGSFNVSHAAIIIEFQFHQIVSPTNPIPSEKQIIRVAI